MLRLRIALTAALLLCSVIGSENVATAQLQPTNEREAGANSSTAQTASVTKDLGETRSPKERYAGANPFAVLTKATASDETSSRFKVRWRYLAGSGNDHGYMIYDRTKKKLFYWEEDGDWYSLHKRIYEFYEVTDQKLKDLVQTYDTDATIDLLFPDRFLTILPQCGFRKHKIQDAVADLSGAKAGRPPKLRPVPDELLSKR